LLIKYWYVAMQTPQKIISSARSPITAVEEDKLYLFFELMKHF